MVPRASALPLARPRELWRVRRYFACTCVRTQKEVCPMRSRCGCSLARPMRPRYFYWTQSNTIRTPFRGALYASLGETRLRLRKIETAAKTAISLAYYSSTIRYSAPECVDSAATIPTISPATATSTISLAARPLPSEGRGRGLGQSGHDSGNDSGNNSGNGMRRMAHAMFGGGARITTLLALAKNVKSRRHDPG